MLSEVNISCKGRAKTGEDPQEEVSGGEQVIGVAGLLCSPTTDFVMVNLHTLHFCSVHQGRLEENTEQLSGDFEDLDRFVPDFETSC